jgi:hypothetical protein
MPDPTLSAAIQEAYASAPTDTIIHHTLELWHPSFTVPIRLVRDNTSIDAMIEAGAARDAGLVVSFTGYAFDVVPPDQTSAGLPECTIEIDNVGREILAQIDAAVMGTAKITVIYRAYLSDQLLLGPENDPPVEMEISHISASPMRISARAGFVNMLDRQFPRLVYDLETFPGLLP